MSIPDLPPPKKRLGQNFLIDPNIVRKIVALAELGSSDHVLEIGPGRGVLTEALCHVAGCVTAVEVDPRLHAYLETRQAELPNVKLVCADALTYPLESLPMGTAVVANLPYYISTPLLFRLLDQRGRFPRMVLMLQAEVADRLAAKPGGPDYGVLSVMAQYAADITKSFRVSAQCFRPRPEVASAVVLLRTKERTGLNQQEEVAFRALVKAAFAHRRKTLVNSLRDEGYELHRVAATLQRLDIAPTRRAETLSVEDFLRLALALG
ncbi:MAG: ribosomal RNA small subunit methyltransferase A [Nitrospirae bacterium]|nr:ribosomal RNA small subunit methyltransferase A [Nitrospirota bacterium]MDE3219602.1 ribosomal RNA small subunit methyltransferase A [Nitrospirota bacterium]